MDETKIVFLNLFSSCSHFANDCGKSHLVDSAHRIGSQTQGDKAIFISIPKPFFHKIRQETASCDTGYFQTDAFFLLGNAADGVSIACGRPFAGNLTSLSHDQLLKLVIDKSKYSRRV